MTGLTTTLTTIGHSTRPYEEPSRPETTWPHLFLHRFPFPQQSSGGRHEVFRRVRRRVSEDLARLINDVELSRRSPMAGKVFVADCLRVDREGATEGWH